MKDLKALRAESGLTLQQLAAKSGVDFTFIHDIENHRAPMSNNAAAGLARALKVNKEALQQAQALAGFRSVAKDFQDLDEAALKKAVVKNTQIAAGAVLALTEVINDESAPLALRQQASKTITRLLDIIDPKEAAQKSRPDPSRDLHGRKRPGKKITRDAVGRAVK